MKISADYIQAFVKNGDGGNLAGVVIDQDLTDDQMQEVAHQIGASETAFVATKGSNRPRVRFFTPTVEVEMCGHATIATWSELARRDVLKAGKYTQETLAGDVQIKINEDESIFIGLAIAQARIQISQNILHDCLGADRADFDLSFTPQIVENDLIVKLNSTQKLAEIMPNKNLMIKISEQYGFYGFHVFAQPRSSSVFAEVRSFVPRVGIDEDAATGTGNAAMLYLLHERGLLKSDLQVKISQGKSLGSESQILGEVSGGMIWVGGKTAKLATRVLECRS